MPFTPKVQCKTCTSLMVFAQRRGSSEGLWVCPVCAARRRIIDVGRDEDEERNGSDRFSRDEYSCFRNKTSIWRIGP